MKISNCYEAALRLFEVSEELKELLDQNQKTHSDKEMKILSGRIERAEIEFLTLKHSLDKISYEEKPLTIFNL